MSPVSQQNILSVSVFEHHFFSFSLSFNSDYLLMLFYQTSQNTCCETCIWSRPLRQCPVGRCTWDIYIDILKLCTGDENISKYPCVNCEILIYIFIYFDSKQFLVRRIFFTLLLDEALRPGISSVGTFAWREVFIRILTWLSISWELLWVGNLFVFLIFFPSY